MTSIPQILIRIRPDGEVELLVQGVRGPICLQLTALLEYGLGDIVERQPTNEYYEEMSQVIDQPLPQKLSS
jgi:hypothetical protein